MTNAGGSKPRQPIGHLSLVILLSARLSPAHQRPARFLRFDEVRDIVDLFSASGLPGSKGEACGRVTRLDRRENSVRERGLQWIECNYQKTGLLATQGWPMGKLLDSE